MSEIKNLNRNDRIFQTTHPEYGVWRVTKTPDKLADWYHIRGVAGEMVLFADELGFWKKAN